MNKAKKHIASERIEYFGTVIVLYVKSLGLFTNSIVNIKFEYTSL